MCIKGIEPSMQNTFLTSKSNDFHESSESNYSLDEISHLIHALSNKLVPITVFSELALRHCKDSQILKHLEKIHLAVEEARAIIAQVQRHGQIDVPASKQEPLSTEPLSKG